jgi:hypothetical protein
MDAQLIELIRDPRTVKTIATTDIHGIPHVTPDPWLHLTEQAEFVHLELHLASTSSRNFINSLWFNRKVAISVSGLHQQHWHVTGIPVKAHVCGPIFQHFYLQVRRELGDVDLAAVYIIKPIEVSNESPVSRQITEDIDHPFYRHLDRLTVHRTSSSDAETKNVAEPCSQGR